MKAPAATARIDARTTRASTLLKAIWVVGKSLDADVAEILGELGITEPQLDMIYMLQAGGSTLSMRDLAHQLNYDPSNVTLIADRLEAMEVVERRVHPSDGRQRVLVLTDKGRAAWRVLLDRLQERSPVLRLSAKEQDQLIALLHKVTPSG